MIAVNKSLTDVASGSGMSGPGAFPQSHSQAVAFVDSNKNPDDRDLLQQRVAAAHATAASLGASIDRFHYGLPGLAAFLNDMRTFDHVIGIDRYPLGLEARVVAAAWTGCSEITFHVGRSLRWILPFAVNRIISDASACRESFIFSDPDAPAPVRRGATPLANEDPAHDIGVVRRGIEACPRAACAYLPCSEGSVAKRLYSASINAGEMRARLRGVFTEHSYTNRPGTDLQAMTQSLRQGRFNIALFEDGEPMELSVSVSAMRPFGRAQSFELLSSFKSAALLLNVLSVLIGLPGF
jgi:hypothetical protein